MSGDIFVVAMSGRGATCGILWVEDKNVVCPTSYNAQDRHLATPSRSLGSPQGCVKWRAFTILVVLSSAS